MKSAMPISANYRLADKNELSEREQFLIGFTEGSGFFKNTWNPFLDIASKRSYPLSCRRGLITQIYFVLLKANILLTRE